MNFARGFGGLALALSNRQFRMYTYGGLPSLIGTWMQRVGIGWLAWELTERNIWVGAVALADMAPVVVIAPIAGAMADRLDRLRVCRMVQYGNMIQALVLAAFTLTGLITIELLVAITCVHGILNASVQPFRQAVVANLVDRDQLPGAIAINSAVWHGSRFVGPAIAGIVVAYWGVGIAFLLNAATFPAFIYVLYRISVPRPPRVARSLAELPAEIAEGIRYVLRHDVIAPMLLVLLVTSFTGRAVLELLPGFAAEVFGRGEGGFATMVSFAGLGAMLGGLWFGSRARLDRLVSMVIVNTLLLGLALLALSLTDSFALSLISLSVAGFGLIIGGIAIQTIVQSVVDEAIRGRVLGLYGWIWAGMPGLGAMLIGGISDIVGLRGPTFVGAAMVLLVGLWGVRRQYAIGGAMNAIVRAPTRDGRDKGRIQP